MKKLIAHQKSLIFLLIFLILTVFLPNKAMAQTSYTWQGGAGDWDNSNMWSPNGVPANGDDVTINSGTVTLNSSKSINDFTFGNATIQGSGSLSIQGTMNWSAGEVKVDIVINSELTLTGDDYKILRGSKITNNGIGTWYGDGSFRMVTGAEFQNQSGAAFYIYTSADLNVPVGPATWNNLGNLSKVAGGGQNVIKCEMNNYGQVSVLVGGLIFDGGGLQSGNFTGSANTSLEFSGAGTVYDFQSISEISSEGTVDFSAGTVNFAGSYSVNGKTTIDGGTLNFMVDNSINDLDLSDGVLEGEGNITVNGEFNWSGGFIQGVGQFTVNRTFNISGDEYKDLNGRTIENNYNCTWSGNGKFRLRYGAVFKNAPSEQFDIQNDETLDLYNGSCSFENEGTIHKQSGGISIFEVPFNNRGEVYIYSGKLYISAGQDSTAQYYIDSGATMEIVTSTHYMENTTISGSGKFEIWGATLYATGLGILLDQDLTTELYSTNSKIDGDGPVYVDGIFKWDAGEITGSDSLYLNNSSTLGGSNIKILKHKTIINNGTASWEDIGYFRIWDGGSFINADGAEFKIKNDEKLDYYSNGGVFINFGTVTKENSDGETIFEVPFNNSGFLNINSGIIKLGSGEDNLCNYNISASTMLLLYSGVHRMNGVIIEGAGDLRIDGGTLWTDFFGATINCPVTILGINTNIDGNGPIEFENSVEWSSGEIAGSDTLFVNGEFSLNGFSRKTLTECVMVNRNSAIWSEDGDFRMQGGAEFINNAGASFDIQNDKLLDSYSGGGSIINKGTFSKSSGGGITTVEVPFDNHGNLLILSGEIRFTGNLENKVDGTIEGTGTLDVASSQFINDGTVSPGPSTGVLNVNGDYVHSTTASLNIELGGNTPGSQYDQLDISQAAILDGLLDISLVGGFTPAEGDSFTVMHYNAINGGFQQIIGANIGGGLKLIPNYFPVMMILVVVDTVNHPPVAINDSLFTDEDTDNSVNVLQNDYDVDGDSISIVDHSTSIYGTVVQISDSSLAYYPALNFFGSDTFSYIISDGKGGLDTAMVYVTVFPVNDPPSLDSIPDITFSEDDSAQLKLNQYVFDVDNDSTAMEFTAEVISAMGFGLKRAPMKNQRQADLPQNTALKTYIHTKKGKIIYYFQISTGDLQIAIDSLTHIATFTATTDSSGIFEVVFTVTDPGFLSDNDTIMTTVNPVNDPPSITDLVIQYNSGTLEIELNWTYPTSVDSFYIYRDTDPYFIPSYGTPYTSVDGATTSWSEPATGTKYFYIVTAEKSCPSPLPVILNNKELRKVSKR
ncbi:MAG: hypothetical protein D4R45_00485 [Planctomycetaceae bacterium]|nr:MAG: hypothetical protein D4R45_00485 [Planctomycetaceae bacterium]